jgi:ribosome-binding protein aMBF1 (putative translation factor)
MSNIGNKETMSKNLKYYIERSGKDRRELADTWGFPYSTVTDWINGKKYPRIDRIEVMAEYFGILKSDLIEERTEEHREMQKKNDTLSDIVIRLQTDNKFMSAVESLYKLDDKKLSSVLALLD